MAESTQRPSHPGVIGVEHGQGDFSSRAVALQDFAPNAVISKLSDATTTSHRTYATVQVSKTRDINLNTDLVYCNHSCDPSIVFDTSAMEVRVVPHRALRKGEALTFFYPSSEWDMSQPFECKCGAGEGICIRTVSGARYLDPKVLRRYWLNAHIVELLREQLPN